MAVNLGGNDDEAYGEGDLQTLLLDFERREFLVVDSDLKHVTWSPTPHPFKKVHQERLRTRPRALRAGP